MLLYMDGVYVYGCVYCMCTMYGLKVLTNDGKTITAEGLSF